MFFKNLFKKILLIFLIFNIVLPLNANVLPQKRVVIAGAFAISAASTYALTQAVVTGQNTQKVIKMINLESKIRSIREYYESTLINYVLIYRFNGNLKYAQNAYNILVNLNWWSSQKEDELDKKTKKFDGIVKMLESEMRKNDKNYKCVNKYAIYREGLIQPPEKISSRLEAWDYGSYKSLKNVEIDYDNLEHDHVPSAAAVLTYLNKRDGKSLSRKKDPDGIIVVNNATTVEVTKAMHKIGRTYFGKNNKIVLKDNKYKMRLYEADAKNLRLATTLDFATYLLEDQEKNYNEAFKIIKAFNAVSIRNKVLCLYEK